MIKRPPLIPPPRDDAELLGAETIGERYGRLITFRFRHRRFDGGWTGEIARDCFDSGAAVILLPYDPLKDEVVLIRQFRTGPYAVGFDPFILECVAGRLDKGGASPEEIANAEAEEEAGLHVEALEPIPGFFASPGIFSEHLTAYCGLVRDAEPGRFGLATEHEDINAEIYPAAKAFAMARGGDILSGPTLVCLFWLELNRERLRAAWSQI